MFDITRLNSTLTTVGLTILAVSSLLSVPAYAADDLRIYGYMAWRIEKVWDEVGRDATGATQNEDAPREMDVPSFNIMMQHRVDKDTKVFLNLNGSGGGVVDVRNIWGEYKLNRYLKLRLGKSYRRFGLYNEYLDAVPTYIGIEPPELFDKDHLILSRETLVMLHGTMPMGEGDLRYSVSTDNGEGGPSSKDNVPIGIDVRYEFNDGDYLVGFSGYFSNGDTVSDVGVGDGSPRSGVLPWMASDDFTVFGAFGEFQVDALKLQVAYWIASHDAVRDAASIVTVINNAGIHANQKDRFLSVDDGTVDAADVDTNGDYDVTTWYVRAGYQMNMMGKDLEPYIQWDVYDNPETIENKTYGGDAEAGLADDGAFSKSTIGLIYRPSPKLAFKFDTSTHFQDVNGKSESYSEIRFDVSFIFGQ